MKDQILELIPEEEAELRGAIEAATSSELPMVFLQFIGQHGLAWLQKSNWPQWLVDVEKIYTSSETTPTV